MNPDDTNRHNLENPDAIRDESAHPAETGGLLSEASGTSQPDTATSDTDTKVSEVKQSFPATMTLIVLIVIAYGLSTYPTFAHPSREAMIFGSFYPPAIDHGEFWRVITATLLHGDPNHLFNNVFGILIFGQILEPVLGARRMVVLYTLSTLLGLAFSYYMLPNVPSIGASTIGYGLIGTYFGLILMFRYGTDRAIFQQELRGTVMFVLLFVGWNILQIETINLWAHLGGFIAGILYALWIWNSRPKSTAQSTGPIS